RGGLYAGALRTDYDGRHADDEPDRKHGIRELVPVRGRTRERGEWQPLVFEAGSLHPGQGLLPRHRPVVQQFARLRTRTLRERLDAQLQREARREPGPERHLERWGRLAAHLHAEDGIGRVRFTARDHVPPREERGRVVHPLAYRRQQRGLHVRRPALEDHGQERQQGHPLLRWQQPLDDHRGRFRQNPHFLVRRLESHLDGDRVGPEPPDRVHVRRILEPRRGEGPNELLRKLHVRGGQVVRDHRPGRKADRGYVRWLEA